MFTLDLNLKQSSINSVDTDIHIGAIGLVIELTFHNGEAIADISSATVKRIYLKKPNGLLLQKDAVFTTNNGVDGKIRYTTVANDIQVRGSWQVQGYIESPTFTGYSSIASFTVYENLDTPE